MNELQGMCVYCNKPAKYTCSLCGALVCQMHFNSKKGVCTSCLSGKKIT